MQLDTLQYTVERTASDLEAVKSNIFALKKDIGVKSEKYVDLRCYLFFDTEINFLFMYYRYCLVSATSVGARQLNSLCFFDSLGYAKKIKEDLQRKLEMTQKGVMTAEEKAAVAAKVFAEEEELVKVLNRDLIRKREANYKKQQVIPLFFLAKIVLRFVVRNHQNSGDL